MKKFSRSLILSTAVALSAAPCLTANAANIMFVMDASGSMKKDAGNGYSRMDNAKYALARMLTDTSDKNRYGLTVYEHRKAKTCGDIQVVAHVGSVGAGFVNEYVQQLTPKGETPIADSVRLAANGFEGYPGQDNQVVLVTDGIEECGGNVCLLAEELGKNHIDLKVSVVGITLNDSQKSGVRCLADQTGGKFYDAADGSSLEAAFAQVKQDIASEKPVVIKSEPIAAPTNQIVFEDHFGADTPTDGWTVQSPNPDQFVTDEGELLIIASGPASSPTKNTMTNVFIHPGALPKGNGRSRSHCALKSSTDRKRSILAQ